MDIERLAYWLLKDVDKAIRDFEMIRSGDRVAVALSGGKDSLTLMQLLDRRRAYAREAYELVAIHILGDGRGPDTPQHAPLYNWLAASGYEYVIEPLNLPADEELPLNCRRCTWNRRKAIFESAHRLGCNVIAMGHHADDLAETTLLNLLHNGRVETMTPVRDYFQGTFRLIRPLCYTKEKDIRRYARRAAFPPPPTECPRSDHTARRLMECLIRQAESVHPNARVNLLRAGLKGIEKHN